MRRDRAIILLAIGQTLAWAGIYYVFPALLVRWEEALGWTKAELTLALTIAVATSALLSPLAGRVIDSGRGPMMMAASGALGGACLLALSQVQTLLQFYALWFVMGAAMAGALYEPCFALVTRNRGERARSGIIVITLLAGFASTISFPVAHLLSEQFGWRATLIVFAIVEVFVVAPVIWFGATLLEKTGDHKDQPHASPAPGVFAALLRRRTYWLLAAGFASIALVHGATLHHLLPLLNERGMSPGFAVFIASLIGPMQVAGRIMMTLTLRRASNHHITIVAYSVIILSIVTLLAAGATRPLVIAFVLLFGSAYGTVSILRPVIAREIMGGRNFGAISGALALPYLVGSAAAPYLGSLVWAAGGYNAMLTGLVCLATIGLALYLGARRAL